MAQDLPLMPKATAVWLVDQTALTFDQIASFCGLHPLEVKGIADGEVASGIRGRDPILNSELTRDEIKTAEEDSSYLMKIIRRKAVIVPLKKRASPRYTPVSRRQDRPNAILWLVRNHPELTDAQIGRLVGTTKPTINGIREGSHWNFSNLKPVDPVSLGLTSQIDLDSAVAKAAKKAGHKPSEATGDTLKPASETIIVDQSELKKEPSVSTPDSLAPMAPKEKEAVPDADSVFAAFSSDKDKKGG